MRTLKNKMDCATTATVKICHKNDHQCVVRSECVSQEERFEEVTHSAAKDVRVGIELSPRRGATPSAQARFFNTAENQAAENSTFDRIWSNLENGVLCEGPGDLVNKENATTVNGIVGESVEQNIARKKVYTRAGFSKNHVMGALSNGSFGLRLC